jgi:hypothetical protein
MFDDVGKLFLNVSCTKARPRHDSPSEAREMGLLLSTIDTIQHGLQDLCMLQTCFSFAITRYEHRACRIELALFTENANRADGRL